MIGVTTGRCVACSRIRPLAALVEVRDRRMPGRRWLVCGPAHGGGDCFRRRAGRASEHSIANALAAELDRREAFR